WAIMSRPFRANFPFWCEAFGMRIHSIYSIHRPQGAASSPACKGGMSIHSIYDKPFRVIQTAFKSLIKSGTLPPNPLQRK
ncbi:MAG: hypothetical protein KDD28_22495, partial [Phaeodactylibacter sp.]|nr:hypothetical protein [Phaeodactylibacter sp.]